MNVVITVLSIIAPLLLVASAGFGTARLGVLDREQVQGLGRFLVVVALPAVLLLAIARLPVSDILTGSFMVAYAAVGTVLGLVLWLVARRLLGASTVEAGTMALGVWVPNNIIIGYPVSQQVMGDASLPYFVAVVLVENALWLPLGLLLLEAGSHGGHIGAASVRKALRRVVMNPIPLAVIFGLLLSVGGVVLPSIVSDTLDLLGGSVSGMALFYVGASLAFASTGDVSRKVGASVGLRLIGGPIMALLMTGLMPGFGPEMATALILFAAGPCFSILPAIVAPYGTRNLGASIQILGTGLSAITLTLVLFWVV